MHCEWLCRSLKPQQEGSWGPVPARTPAVVRQMCPLGEPQSRRLAAPGASFWLCFYSLTPLLAWYPVLLLIL